MKKIFSAATMILMITALFGVNSSSYAQPGSGSASGPPPDRIERRMTILKERLALNNEQAAKIRAILEEEQKSMMGEREKSKGDKKAMSDFREKHRQATDARIKALLTKEQQTKFDKMNEEMRKNLPGRGDQKGSKKGNPEEAKQGATGAENK